MWDSRAFPTQRSCDPEKVSALPLKGWRLVNPESKSDSFHDIISWVVEWEVYAMSAPDVTLTVKTRLISLIFHVPTFISDLIHQIVLHNVKCKMSQNPYKINVNVFPTKSLVAM